MTLLCGNALSVPFADCTFSGAYMLHVGMNIADKTGLFSELARVLRPGARLGVYDVVRTADGALNYPLPWATADDTNCIAPPDDYRHALKAAGFEVLAEQSRRDVALAHFNQQRSQGSAANGPAPLGLHTLMGERRPAQVRNMLEGISTGRVAPFNSLPTRNRLRSRTFATAVVGSTRILLGDVGILAILQEHADIKRARCRCP